MSSGEEKRIRAIVAACEQAWNASDAAGFCAAMAEDIDFINVLGEHHQGRDAVERGHRRIFDTIYKDSRVHFQVDDIRFLRPDIALAFTHARLISRLPAGAIAAAGREAKISDEMHESHARPTMVLVKDDKDWRIVAFQNTSVAAKPSALV